MRSATSALYAAPALLACASACSSTYHPEYHPETSYTYAQEVTYVKNAVYASARPTQPEAAPCLRDLQHCPTGAVSSPGGVVIYGDFTGNIYLAR